MKLTKQQQNDIDVIKYFIGKDYKNISITDEDIEMFLGYSERGLNKNWATLTDKMFLYPKELIQDIMNTWELNTVPRFSVNGIINEVSESGISVDDFLRHKGFFVLLMGKRWRGITIHELWEEGVIEGSVPYFTLLGGFDEPLPRNVVDFMKKEMFKGIDADIIENCYQSILKTCPVKTVMRDVE